jgi:hypothetical protein
LVFSPLDNRGPEKVPGARKIGLREKERELGNDEKCQEKRTTFSLMLRLGQTPSFRGVKTPLSINPEQTQGFRPGKVEGLIFEFWVLGL